MRLSEISLYAKYPWAVPVVPDIDPNEGFYDVKPWNFQQPVLELIEKMFEEVDRYFNERNMLVEVVIFEIRDVLGTLRVTSLTPHPEVTEIFEKYGELSKKLLPQWV